MQLHDPAPFCSLHTVLLPHGLGLHGFLFSSIGGAVLKIQLHRLKSNSNNNFKTITNNNQK
jgi:hypothetical protein